MTIPPAMLTARLAPFDGVLGLRNHDGTAAGSAQYTDALALAIRGEVEGVASAGGRIRYLRYLPDSARPAVVEKPHSQDETGGILANCAIGAYREAVRNSAGDLTGHIWQLCLCRGRIG